MLPDVALLGIFDFYLYEAWTDAWHTLVHVCRKWRFIVFGSPHRLDLRLFCTERRGTLDIWPPLPILIETHGYRRGRRLDDIIMTLKHNDRICHLVLDLVLQIPTLQMKHFLTAMHQPFPMLTYLCLSLDGETVPVIPGSFLGGSAPRLQTFHFWGYQKYFCLPLTLSILSFGTPSTFHPM